MLEVEIKARGRVEEAALLALGAVESGFEEHLDLYFNSPVRDFRKTDEALRVRKVNGSYKLTYKGPRIDSETKTREELEIEVDSGISHVLERLGFVPAMSVKKKRRIFRLEDITICLDEVEGLGSFIELEASDLSRKERLFELMSSLGIRREATIKRSYLELLESLDD